MCSSSFHNWSEHITLKWRSSEKIIRRLRFGRPSLEFCPMLKWLCFFVFCWVKIRLHFWIFQRRTLILGRCKTKCMRVWWYFSSQIRSNLILYRRALSKFTSTTFNFGQNFKQTVCQRPTNSFRCYKHLPRTSKSIKPEPWKAKSHFSLRPSKFSFFHIFFPENRKSSTNFCFFWRCKSKVKLFYGFAIGIENSVRTNYFRCRKKNLENRNSMFAFSFRCCLVLFFYDRYFSSGRNKENFFIDFLFLRIRIIIVL